MPRYFVDAQGAPVYLTGSSNSTTLQDRGTTSPPPVFDYDAYLAFLVAHNHNFFRLFVWEQPRWTPGRNYDFYYDPLPFARPGPGTANDGKPKFDVNSFNQAFFDRMRERVQAADQLGIYVAVMLFEGWSVDDKEWGGFNPWDSHPFNADNNINGIDGDADNDGQGTEIHTLLDNQIRAVQEAYVRKVIDTVNEFDNVLYEISNESDGSSVQWQYHFIDFVRNYEATKPKQHPVGMTVPWRNGTNQSLYDSSADWISPKLRSGESITQPLPAGGDKVILYDSDHLCGTCGDVDWVWKSFLMGYNTLFFDIYTEIPKGDEGDAPNDPKWELMRRNLGYARTIAQRLPLADVHASPQLASSGYCLASDNDADPHYVALVTSGDSVTVDLSGISGSLQVEWVNFAGDTAMGSPVTAGAPQTLSSPLGGDSVVYLHR